MPMSIILFLIGFAVNSIAAPKSLMPAVCTGQLGTYEVTVSPKRDKPGFSEISITAQKLSEKEKAIQFAFINAEGDFQILGRWTLGKNQTVSFSVEDLALEKVSQIMLQVAGAKVDEWVESAGRNTAYCYPKGTGQNVKPPEEMKDRKALDFVITFGEDEFAGKCNGAIISKEQLGKQCRYTLLTVAHCLKQLEKGKQLLATWLEFPTLAALNLEPNSEIEVSIHPKYSHLPFERYDVGLAKFTAPCLSDEKLPIYSVNDEKPSHGEACAILGNEGPFLAVINSTQHAPHNIGVDWSLLQEQNKGKETPRSGWSGSPIIKKREIVGCYYSSSTDETVPYGMCSSGECMTWVKTQLRPEIKLR